MPVRSFTVFQDTPTPQPRNDSHEGVILSLSETAAILLSTPAIEKENLHPVTGERAGPASGSEAKKRKTGALATKQLVVSSSKKQKEHKPDSKKSRKPLSSVGKPKSSDGRKSSSKTSRSSRRASPLPPVEEEQELKRQPARLSGSQAGIDSRCYELTVLPLADVSEAYEASPAESPEPDAHTDREQSVEPAIRDYFSPSLVEKPHPATDKQQCNIDDSNNDFSTPERKRIYSAFTFSSPSPTSERFKRSQVSLIHRDVPASNSE
ncbi:hypothetical protein PAXRUDRAFT_830812 [Paxillus rubicundulus Ve08.2h10]|uniref:Uncharacterized protein n=1 Tax=Paxillus rubicundulus Ve08.2h10 TaxID=930991 RepID=A0A0D0DSZ4_9AGAM|nr:hypothetical protein PAXRUDRAFT_830812 [Paxillus rubicundulus Ve08.2h10]